MFFLQSVRAQAAKAGSRVQDDPGVIRLVWLPGFGLMEEETGGSHEELAHRCGVHRTYVGSVERGEYNVTVLTLRRITGALRISLHEALRRCVKRHLFADIYG